MLAVSVESSASSRRCFSPLLIAPVCWSIWSAEKPKLPNRALTSEMIICGRRAMIHSMAVSFSKSV